MTTFIQLKSRLINILMNALQVEVDPQNTHMLLGGLMLCVQDSTLFEECADINAEMRQTSPVPSDTNLLSSGTMRENTHFRTICTQPTYTIHSAQFVLCGI